MSAWLISAIVILVLIVLLIIIGIVLCLHLSINNNFQTQASLVMVMMDQHPILESSAKIYRSEAATDEAQTRSLLKVPSMSSLNPMEVIKTAEKVWSFVDSHRAQVDVRGTYGSFSPTQIQDPYKFQGWSSPANSHSYTVNIYNRLGLQIVQFEYTLQFAHSGNLHKKELYLDNVTIIPSRVYVAWGFKFNADVQMSSVRNVGTTDHPIAAVSIDQHYRLIGLNTVQRTDSFEVRGDGKYKYLNQS